MPALGGSGGACIARRGGCDGPGRGGGANPGADGPGRGVAAAGGGVEPGLPGVNPGRGGGNGSFDGDDAGAAFTGPPAAAGLCAKDSAAAA